MFRIYISCRSRRKRKSRPIELICSSSMGGTGSLTPVKWENASQLQRFQWYDGQNHNGLLRDHQRPGRADILKRVLRIDLSTHPRTVNTFPLTGSNLAPFLNMRMCEHPKTRHGPYIIIQAIHSYCNQTIQSIEFPSLSCSCS